MPDLANHVVVVNGAAGRLGRVVCAHLAAAGATVVAVDREAPEPPDAGERPARFVGVAADVTDESGVRHAFAVAAESGPITGLIHTVGMWAGAPLAETGLDAWETLLRVNLTSAFLAFREASRRMADGGRLVAIASGQGADRGVAEQAGYSASKAGVVRLVESATAELAPRGITAAAVAPSTILFGDEDPGTPGVAVDEIAALCVRLLGPDGAAHAGETIRAYGTAG